MDPNTVGSHGMRTWFLLPCFCVFNESVNLRIYKKMLQKDEQKEGG